MKRTQIYLEDEQDASLTKRASAAGVTKSMLIRQAIDSFLQGPQDEGSRLARFRAAVDKIDESPLTLEPGRTYVERVRARDMRRQETLERRRA